MATTQFFTSKKGVFLFLFFFYVNSQATTNCIGGREKWILNEDGAGKRRKTFYLKKKNESICKKLELTKLQKEKTFIQK